jgi:hypothetical protein
MQRIQDKNEFYISEEDKNKSLEEIQTEEEIRLRNFKEEKFTLDLQAVGMKILKV